MKPATMEPTLGRGLSNKERLGYGMGDFGFNLYWQATALFLYFFYTDVMKLPPGVAGVVYGIASLWDAISDPLMGAFADRTRTRWGSYRPYILFGAIPCALSFVLCFWVPPLQGRSLILYATITLIALRTAYTVANIPYLALSAKLSSDYQERNVLAGTRMVFAACGGLIVTFFVPLVVESYPGDAMRGWLGASIFLAVLATLVLVLCFSATREPSLPSDSVIPAKLSIAQDVAYFWNILRRNGPLARLFIAIAVSYSAGQMFSKMMVYWFKYGLQNQAFIKYALPAGPVAMIVMTPFWVWLARRTSKRSTWLVGLTVSAIGMLAFFFDDSGSVNVALVLIVLTAAGSICTPIMYFAMIPDTADYNELQTGRRDEAKIFGFAIFAQKAALAMNAVALGQLLEVTHFAPNAQQGVSTLLGMKAIMCLVPVLGTLATAAAIWRYPLDASRHANVLVELEKRAA